MQHSVTFHSLPRVASDVLLNVAIADVGLDVIVKFGRSRSNHSRDICRPVQFVWQYVRMANGGENMELTGQGKASHCHPSSN